MLLHFVTVYQWSQAVTQETVFRLCSQAAAQGTHCSLIGLKVETMGQDRCWDNCSAAGYCMLHLTHGQLQCLSHSVVRKLSLTLSAMSRYGHNIIYACKTDH